LLSRGCHPSAAQIDLDRPDGIAYTRRAVNRFTAAETVTMTEQTFWHLFEVVGLATAALLLLPVTALPRLLGRLLHGLAEDAEIRGQARLIGLVAAWLLLLSSLLRIAWGGSDAGARTWLAMLASLGWFALVLATDLGKLSALAFLGRLAGRVGRLLDPQQSGPDAESPTKSDAAPPAAA
jgi:hypothetical protein